jgi:hypothetical protein
MRLIAIILGLLLVNGCNEGGDDRGGGGGASAIRSGLESAVASGATSFDFAADPAFAWDRLYVFDCYSRRASVEKSLGFAWPEFDKTTLASSDSVVLVVFVRDGKVVGWYEQPRTIELGGLANGEGYSRSEARFEVDRARGRVELRRASAATRAAG